MTEPHIESWGRYPRLPHQAVHPVRSADPLPEGPASMLPYGQGRSYGDVCLNANGTLLSTSPMRRLLAFDPETGRLRCEAGITLAEVLAHIVPQGWFLPVSPGTQFVSIGGAIANDIHGKNHHRAGTFGRYVRQFELLRSTGERFVCTPETRADFYRATIGGLGLTGLITWAEIQLLPIPGPFIEATYLRFKNLEAFFEIAAASDADYAYTVAWVDCTTRGKDLGRGLFIRGNHADVPPADAPRTPGSRSITFPFDAPGFLLNRFSVRAFNTLYYHRPVRPGVPRLVHYKPFFYPLDALLKWNRMYGKRGFFQYQLVVPFAEDRTAIRRIFETIAASGLASFLAVLKTFGPVPSPGLLSFPRPGVTLALDFPNQGARTHRLFEALDALVQAAGGAVYPAKDARMPPELFTASFPNWPDFVPYIDPRFSSSFWRRVTGG